MSLKSNEVIKHSGAVHISNEITLLQRRTWNILLANAFDELLNSEYHTISIDKLCETLEYNSNNIGHIKEYLEGLVSTTLEWNVLHKDGKNEWGVTSLLADVSIIDGIIKYSYSYGLRHKLFNPVMYTKLSLIIQNKFNSKHSLCLYELCLDYFDIKRNSGETQWISIIDLRKLFGLSSKEYQRFSDLNHCILKKSISEINEITDLFVEYKTKRIKNKISFLKFIINKKNGKNILIDVEYEEKVEGVCKTLIDDFGVELSLAIKLVNEYDESQILKNINYVKNYKKVIKNLPGLVVDAIKNNWQISKNNNQETSTQNIIPNSENKLSIDSIKSELNIKRKNRALKIFSELSEKEKNELKNEYIEKVKSGDYGAFLKKSFNTSGFDGTGLHLQFNSVFLQEKFLETTIDEELEMYMKINNEKEK